MSSTELANYMKLSIRADIVPFEWKSRDEGGGVTTLKTCLAKGYHEYLSKTPEHEFSKIKRFIRNKGFILFSQLETTFECSGFCNVPLFYINKPISAGSPKKECLGTIVAVITR